MRTVEITSTLHVSNRCSLRRKCHYCGFAAKTSEEGYYRLTEKSDGEIVEAAKAVEESGIGRISVSAGYGNFKRVLRAVELIRLHTDLKILVNVGGDLDREGVRLLAELGVETVCCNLETVNEKLFYKLKPDDDLRQRIRVCEWVKEEGLLLSSGLLVGIGETEGDRQRHIELLKVLEVDEVPVMGFRPYRGTPMEKHPPAPLGLVVDVIRRVKDAIPNLRRITIPFPIVGFEGLKPCLDAGANNVATVVPKSYPLEVKGVGSPTVGILEELLPLLESWGYKTLCEYTKIFNGDG